jgi:antitoxin component YwqK of YwqJK toxin-antitoxin module
VAVKDACEGELKEWTESGQLFHLAHYKNGQEDGVQKMWHANGKIRSNFVLIQGRRYGLLGTKNCRNFNEKILAY